MKKTVKIQKADIPLLDGESIQMFERKLRDEMQKKFGKKATATNKVSTYVWPRAVFADRVIMEKEIPGGPYELQLVTFKRADNGGFEFGEPVPVREQVNFVPVGKSVDGEPEMEEMEVDDIWSGLSLL